MHLLVTNDDGIRAPGLQALAEAVAPFGTITILAPNRNWSASGHVKTLTRPLRVEEVSLANGRSAIACDGAPSDCVALADLGIIKKPIDLVVSGINAGPNMGHDVTYSGTVTAAMEAVIAGIPGIAFSFAGYAKDYDLETAKAIIHQVMEKVTTHPIDKAMLLNINIPLLPLDQIKGIRITRQGQRIYRDELEKRLDPRGRPYYWIAGDVPDGVVEDGTDFGAIADGFVSITPLQLDLTDYEMAQKLSSWF